MGLEGAYGVLFYVCSIASNARCVIDVFGSGVGENRENRCFSRTHYTAVIIVGELDRF